MIPDGYTFTASNPQFMNNNDKNDFLVMGKIPLSYYNKIRNELTKQNEWVEIKEDIHESRLEHHFYNDKDINDSDSPE